MSTRLKVISGRPAGGRCKLYAAYAKEAAHRFGLPVEINYDDKKEPHGEGYPSLLIDDEPVIPSDGVILSPEDVCAVLAKKGIDQQAAASFQEQLQQIQETMFQEG